MLVWSRYLQDRKLHEDEWLRTLHTSPIDCDLIWGTLDPVAVLAIADYVWDNFLQHRPNATAKYTKIVGASHYLQVDHATNVSSIVLGALAQKGLIKLE